MKPYDWILVDDDACYIKACGTSIELVVYQRKDFTWKWRVDDNHGVICGGEATSMEEAKVSATFSAKGYILDTIQQFTKILESL